MRLIFAATGHRPEKLGGHAAHVDARLLDLARWFLAAKRPDEAISGMALGWDTAFALAALDLGIPLVAAVPFAGQERMWTLDAKRRYHALLERAARVVVVSDGEYSARKMHRRDRWMVDSCTHLVALWDGSPSGTGGTVNYANERRVSGWNLWEYWQSCTK